MSAPTPPPPVEESGGNSGCMVGFFEVFFLGVIVAPIVLVLALIFGWGRWVIIPSAALTVLFAGAMFWAGRIEKDDKAREATTAGEFPKIAAAHGYRYAEAVPALAGDLAGVHPFLGLAEATARHVVRGTVGGGYPFAIVRYAGKLANSTMDGLAILVALPRLLPPLEIDLAWEIGKATQSARRVPILLEDAAFNQRYRLQTYDHTDAARKYAVDVMNPRAMQVQLSFTDPFDSLLWTIEDGFMKVISVGATLDPEQLEKQLRWAQALGAILDTIPAFVWQSAPPAAVPASFRADASR